MKTIKMLTKEVDGKLCFDMAGTVAQLIPEMPPIRELFDSSLPENEREEMARSISLEAVINNENGGFEAIIVLKQDEKILASLPLSMLFGQINDEQSEELEA